MSNIKLRATNEQARKTKQTKTHRHVTVQCLPEERGWRDSNE